MSAVFSTIIADVIDIRPDMGVAGEVQDFKISDLIVTAINAIFVLAVIIFFFMLVWGGIRWITSGGDKAQTETARSQITNAIIGLVITLSAYAILNLIALVLGVGSIFELLIIEKVTGN